MSLISALTSGTVSNAAPPRRARIIIRKNANLEKVAQLSQNDLASLSAPSHAHLSQSTSQSNDHLSQSNATNSIPLAPTISEAKTMVAQSLEHNVESVAAPVTKKRRGLDLPSSTSTTTSTKRRTAADLQRDLELLTNQVAYLEETISDLRQDKLDLQKRCDALQAQVEKERMKADAKSDANFAALFNQQAALSKHQAKMCETMTLSQTQTLQQVSTGLVASQGIGLKSMVASLRSQTKCTEPTDLVGYLNKTYSHNPLLARGRLEELEASLATWRDMTNKMPETQRRATIEAIDEDAPKIVEVLETEHRLIKNAIEKATLSTKPA